MFTFSQLLSELFRKFTTGATIGLLGLFGQQAHPPSPTGSVPDLKQFTSCVDLKAQISKASAGSGYGYDMYANKGIAMPMQTAPSMPVSTGLGNPIADTLESGPGATDYSTTNVQVAGVDEGDIIKNDGKYVYHLTKNRLAISSIYPVDQAKLVSITDLSDQTNSFQPTDVYIDGDRLMLIGTSWNQQVYPAPMPLNTFMMGRPTIMPIWQGRSLTVAQVWNISDRSKPSKVRTVEFDGSMVSSRLVNGHVYFVMNAWSQWGDQSPATESTLVPNYRDTQSGTSFKPIAPCGDVRYFDVQPSNQYLIVASVGMNDMNAVERTVILGSGQTVYASPSNLYIARQDWNYQPVRDTAYPDTLTQESTLIYRFAFKDGDVSFQAKGRVPGTLLNQFSMDESDNNFRIATTQGNVWDHANPSTNNLYVLGSDLQRRGSIEGIAPGEKIYSVRFMGKRGYMVTFKKTDPLFAFDLSNPDAPKLLGKLQIPGYSDYLQPMDDNHLIGIGKNAVDAEGQYFAWYQGIKLAVFDVTDIQHPKQMWTTDIGDRGTDSPALHDHKAFLYAPSKQLLALPITLAELDPSVKQDPTRQGNEYGQFTFQGAYVYRLTLDKGFEYLGRVTHQDSNDQVLKSGGYWYGGDDDVSRVGYIDSSLMTVSNGKLQFNKLYDLTKQATVAYPVPPAPVPQPYPIEGGIMPMMK